MAGLSLEERMAVLEAQVAELKQQFTSDKLPHPVPWWEQRFGAFANSDEYAEATRLGQAYRESLRPKNGTDDPA